MSDPEKGPTELRHELIGYLNKLAVELGYGRISVSEMQQVIPTHVVAAGKLAQIIDAKKDIPLEQIPLAQELINYYNEAKTGEEEGTRGTAKVDYGGRRGVEKPTIKWPWQK
jgi:hypothetical protein